MKGVAPAIRCTPILARPGLYVLAHTNAPAVLIEHGFHTSREDVAYLKGSGCREKLAQAEVRSILGSHSVRGGPGGHYTLKFTEYSLIYEKRHGWPPCLFRNYIVGEFHNSFSGVKSTS